MTEIESLGLAALYAYARCPYEYLWRYVAEIVPPPTARGLVENTLHDALQAYCSGCGEGLVQCAGQAWREMMETWGYGDEAWELLVKFASTRARVLEPFLSGRLTKRDGTRYKAPEMSNEYKRRANQAGLPHLEARLQELLAEPPVYVDETYTIADAFSECVEIASRNTWPTSGVSSVIVGCDVPFTVSLTDDLAVSGTADLVFGVGGQKGQVCIEVHDFGAVLPPVPVVRRDLRVVAALHAEGAWAGVDCVVFRHLRSGETVSVSRSSGTGRLLTAVVAAAAGIRITSCGCCAGTGPATTRRTRSTSWSSWTGKRAIWRILSFTTTMTRWPNSGTRWAATPILKRRCSTSGGCACAPGPTSPCRCASFGGVL